MDLSDIFSISKGVIDAIQKTISDNEQISGKIDKAGGLIALVGVGIDLYKEIKENLKTPEEKAFGSLLNVTFGSTHRLLDEIKSKFLKDEHLKLTTKNNRKELMTRLLNSFTKASEWNCYLPDHPAIDNFRSEIVYQLRSLGCNYEVLNYFIMKFNVNLEYDAEKDKKIKVFYDWWTKEDKYKVLHEYLEFVKTQKYFVKGLDQRPLYEYYIEQNAIPRGPNTWNLEDEGLCQNNKREIQDIVHDFLEKDKRWYIVIGAPFGIGKTSVVRMLASNYATGYLYSKRDAITSTNSGYIPIPVFLKDGLNNVYNQNNLNYVLEEIVAPNPQACKRKILLILDGLDEYPYPTDIGKLMNDILRDKYRIRYTNMKVIITTRLKAGLHEELKINDHNNEYVRLLPFTREQIDRFFENYFTYEQAQELFQKYHVERLSYNYILKDLGLEDGSNIPNEEISKPLFTWMLSLIYTDPEVKLEFNKQWSRNMRRSLIYMFFIHHVIKGKYKDEGKRWLESYFLEKKALREIAVLKQIYGKDLTLDHVENRLNKFDSKIDVSDNLEPILTSYFHFPYMNTGRSIDFVHETFKEYLVAEFYIESLLKDKAYRLNIGTPTKETTAFLEGLIELMDSKNKDTVAKFIESDKNNQISLLNSFNYNKGTQFAKDHLLNCTLSSINNESIVFLNFNTDTKEDMWKVANITMDSYRNLWIHRWISLYILNTLMSEKVFERINKEKLRNLIIGSGVDIPDYLKKLKYADLTCSNLADANLSCANLAGANFSGANLMNANLFNANLAGANLMNANLADANLSCANLAGANLSRARLTDSNLSASNLSCANLSRARLTDSNLSASNLSCANLAGANLSRARLMYSMLISCKQYDNLICGNADLDKAIFDSKGLERYLKNKSAKNVPEAITDRYSLQTILKHRRIDDVMIKELLELSLLSYNSEQTKIL
jgi:uncharacterized protein YjbI with pentapeptide repeats